MATISQNNIQFSNINNDPIFAPNGRFSVMYNDDGTGKFDTTLTGNEITKSLNAVEIDWNGAVLPNSSTTIGKQTTNRIGEIIRWN